MFGGPEKPTAKSLNTAGSAQSPCVCRATATAERRTRSWERRSRSPTALPPSPSKRARRGIENPSRCSLGIDKPAAPPGRPARVPAVLCTPVESAGPGEESVQAWASRVPVSPGRAGDRTCHQLQEQQADGPCSRLSEIPKISAYFEPLMWAVYVPKPLRDRNRCRHA